jgi:hypothetical protein
MSILWDCVHVALRIARDIIDGLIPAAILNELGSLFSCLVINQTLSHCRRPSMLSIKPVLKKINRLREYHLCKIAHLGDVEAIIRGGFSGDSASNAAKTRQTSDPNAVVIPMARSTGICERASTPNTKIVVVLHTTRP